MKQEVISTGKTIEAAVASGAAELGAAREDVVYEVLEQPKKGFFGIGETLAKVRITYTLTPEQIALDFVNRLLADMEIEAQTEITEIAGGKGDRLLNITGEGAGALIGHHGETLDSLQYLVNLAANRRDDDEESEGALRISVDIGGYRAKREETLRNLARHMAAKVKKFRKSITLEPMTPYERRIIHSEIQGMQGVSTTSIGTDNNRRVVIFLEGEGPEGGRYGRSRGTGRGRGRAAQTQQSSTPSYETGSLSSNDDEE